MERILWVKEYWSNYYDGSVNKYGVKCGTFGKITDRLIL